MSEKDNILNGAEPENSAAEENTTVSEETVNEAETETVNEAANEISTEKTEEATADNGNDKKANKKNKNGKKLKTAMFGRRSIFMMVTGIILVVVLILANVISVTIANRLPTTWDVTADNSNSLTKENIDFIKSINQDVTVTVCATREGYTGSEMVNNAYNNYYVQENSSPYNYYNQTITMVESYPKYNSHIKVEYVDIQSPDFNTIKKDISSEINYGDIIVTTIKNGITSQKIITFTDVYELYDNSQSSSAAYGGYSYYTITSSDIESQLSSAIYTVAASEKATIAIFNGHGTKDATTGISSDLQKYNYEIKNIDGAITADSLKDVTTAILIKPVSDLNGDELKVLDSFLDNGGKHGKSFLVFGSTASPETPNLNEFMEDWGIGVQDAMAFETDSEKRAQQQTTILLTNKKDDLTKNMNASELYYYCDSNIALKQAFTEKGTRTSHILMSTSETAVLAPKSTTNGYTPPSDATKAEIPVIMLTTDIELDEDSNNLTSYVGYFGSSDFISSDWLNYTDIGNIDYAINIINVASGRDGSSMYFLPKTTGTFSVSFTEAQKNVAVAITLFIVPIGVLIAGIGVWIFRKVKH